MMIPVRRIARPTCPFEIGNEEPDSPKSPSPPPSAGITGGGGPGRRSSTTIGIKTLVLCNHGRWNRLRNEIFLLARNTVIERPTVHRRQLFSKVTMSRRRRGSPLERSRVPRVPFEDSPSPKNTDKEVKQEDQLGGTQDKGRNADENIYRLLRHKKHVLRRIVNAPHL